MNGTAGPPSLHQVADDVFAYVQPDGGWCLSNAGVVVSDETTVLIDTAATQARARLLRDHVARVASTMPTVLVNTHHHGDHVFGNAEFAPPATVVAHERARTEIIDSGLGLQRLWPEVDWGETRLVAPTLTFKNAITLHAGKLLVEVFHVGPAHTTNDVVAWIPDRRVLFCGDVALAGATPYCLMGSVIGSLRAIDRLRALGADIVVPGHGPISGPAVFDETESYLRWLQRVAQAGVDADLSPLQTAREADLAEFADLLDSERLVGNLYRAYVEIEGSPLGTPIDVLTPFQEMVSYNGGLPRCHA